MKSVGEKGFLDISLLEQENSDNSLIFLFDNSFSWYRPKKIKYRIKIMEKENLKVQNIPHQLEVSNNLIENNLTENTKDKSS